MKNKPNDRPYLGCRADKIKSAQPVLNIENFKHLHRWITDRYAVHIKKDVQKLPAPWTDNPIIQEFRFTNVRREHDKETKWVIENICSISEESMSWASKICNLILFRMFNKSQTCKNFMPINFDEGIDWTKISTYFENLPDGYVPFTNAFITGGLKMSCCKELGYTSSYKDPVNGLKPEYAVIRYVESLYNSEDKIINLGQSVTAQEFVTSLNNIPGLGYFLAYQIFVDYTYCPEAEWSENEFVVAGPGARRGLDLVFDNRDGMTYEEALFWLRDNWLVICNWLQLPWNPDEIFTDLEPEDRYMNVMSLQNCHCEISKYIRAVNGTGRPRNKYHYKEGV